MNTIEQRNKNNARAITINNELSKLEPLIRRGTDIEIRVDGYSYLGHGTLNSLPTEYADEQIRLRNIADVLISGVIPHLSYDGDLSEIRVLLDTQLWFRIIGSGSDHELNFITGLLPDLYDHLHSDVYPLVAHTELLFNDEIYAMLILVRLSEKSTPVEYDPDFRVTIDDQAAAEELLRRCSDEFPITHEELLTLFPLD